MLSFAINLEFKAASFLLITAHLKFNLNNTAIKNTVASYTINVQSEKLLKRTGIWEN